MYLYMKERKRKLYGRRQLTLLLTVLLIIAGSVQVFAASSVKYIGPLWTSTSQGLVRVGHFTVNGKTAFCMEHSKNSPETGVSVSQKVYKNEKIRKILYYGWKGPGQWKGFSGQKQGITLTSLLLSEVYSKAQPVGTYNFVPGLVEFRKYVNGQPAPSLDLKFSKSSVSSYYDGDLDAERTESIKVTGTGGGKIRVTVPAGCLLHDNSDGSESSGKVVLNAGDSFYIRSTGSFSDTERTVIKGRRTALQPIVFVTSSSSVQDLTQLDYAEDTADSTLLTVKWMGKPDLRLIKYDASSGKTVSGAVFRLFELDDEGRVLNGESADDIAALRSSEEAVGTYTTAADGRILVKDCLQLGHSYLVIEQKAPDGYRLSDEIKTFKVSGEKSVEEISFDDERQVVHIKIDKKGKKYSVTDGRLEAEDEPLGGAVFEIRAAEDIADWGSDSILYRSGALVETLTTDENGKASSGDLPAGKYSVKEIEAPFGYIADEDIGTYNLKLDEDKLELSYTVSSLNYPNESLIKVVKYDKASRKTLEGAHFTIENEDGESIELCTGEDGSASISNLPPGEYIFTEVKAPDGYKLDTKPRRFTLSGSENGETVVLESYDERIEAPNTSDDRLVIVRLLIYSVLFAACIIAIDVKLLRHRKH